MEKSGIKRNTWRPAAKTPLKPKTNGKGVKKSAIIGEEATVTEEVCVASAMWVSKTLLVLKLKLQQTHPAGMVQPVLSIQEAGVGSSTSSTRGTREIKIETGTEPVRE